MSFYDDASLVLIPSGVKAAKVYSQKPTNGTGDFTFARASTATRTNASGAIESVASDVPRLDYMTAGGSMSTCPILAVAQQRTNLVFPSDVATTQTRTVTATAHTLTFYGTGSVTLSGVATGTLTGTGANNRVALTFTPTAGSLVLTVSGTVINWQLEAGAFSTTLIETTTAAATRIKDDVYITGASALIGQTEGSIFLDMDFRVVSSAGARTFAALEGTAAASVIPITGPSGGTSVQFLGFSAATATGRHKIVATYNVAANESRFYRDGVLLNTTTFAALASTMDKISILCRINTSGTTITQQAFGGFYQFALWKTSLSNAECIELSTL